MATNPDRSGSRLRVPEGTVNHSGRGSVAEELEICLIHILMDQETDLLLEVQLDSGPQGLPLMANLSLSARSCIQRGL